MSSRAIVWHTAIAGVVGGVVGGGLVAAWEEATAPESAPEPRVEVSAEPPSSEPGGPAMAPPAEGTQQRIARMEAELKTLRRRMTEQARIEGTREGGDAGEGERVTLNASDPAFKHAVRTVLDQARDEQERERLDRREDQHEEMVLRQVDELIDELKLDDAQADQLDTILRDQGLRFRELFGGENRPVTQKEWRDSFEEVRKQTRERLANVLDDKQLEGYDRHQAQAWGGPGGARR